MVIKYCKRCDKGIDEKEDICPNCGNPVSEKRQGIINKEKVKENKKTLLLVEKYKYCAICEEKMDSKEDICPNCGNFVSNRDFQLCKYCESEISKEASFCRYCKNIPNSFLEKNQKHTFYEFGFKILQDARFSEILFNKKL